MINTELMALVVLSSVVVTFVRLHGLKPIEIYHHRGSAGGN